jgi:transcriptional regulator with XRE-family HTH domain
VVPDFLFFVFITYCGKPNKINKSGTSVFLHLTQDYAETVGISQGRLSEIEKGKTKPSAERLNELRKKFSVDLNWLFDDDG